MSLPPPSIMINNTKTIYTLRRVEIVRGMTGKGKMFLTTNTDSEKKNSTVWDWTRYKHSFLSWGQEDTQKRRYGPMRHTRGRCPHVKRRQSWRSWVWTTLDISCFRSDVKNCPRIEINDPWSVRQFYVFFFRLLINNMSMSDVSVRLTTGWLKVILRVTLLLQIKTFVGIITKI